MRSTGTEKTLCVQVYCGLTSGLAMMTLTTIFLPVSGAHISPAVSLATALIRRVSPARALGEDYTCNNKTKFVRLCLSY